MAFGSPLSRSVRARRGSADGRVQRHQPIAEAGGHVDVVNDDDDPEVELTAELLLTSVSTST